MFQNDLGDILFYPESRFGLQQYEALQGVRDAGAVRAAYAVHFGAGQPITTDPDGNPTGLQSGLYDGIGPTVKCRTAIGAEEVVIGRITVIGAY